MKIPNKVYAACWALSIVCGASAQTFAEWQDPETNAVNRLPIRTSFFAYESADAAQRGDKSLSERFLPLDGRWRFCWVRHADERPTDFYREDYDDRGWETMPVPGVWELNGWGDPVYLNIGYPWREQEAVEPPAVPVRENHVGSYRREVEIPASWAGRRIVAHFGSATSNLYLWINGRFVGYGEDSKLESEFDVTRFVKPGKNLFALQIFRWSDGTWVEDQDFFRLSGLARESYLYATPKACVEDVRLRPSLSEQYTHGRLDAELTLSAAARGCRVEVALAAPDGTPVAVQEAKVTGATVRLALDAGEVRCWSAELPTLYGVTVTLRDAAGHLLETIPLRAGFRDVKIAGGRLLVNGRPVLIKGANRHEMDPDGGYVVSRERMLQDVRLLKENNFNAVRTCHYPDDPYWYELCDRYGIYLVAEANLESHGMGYGERSLAKNPLFARTHLERNERNVRRNFNHPSVILWSLGNEAGDGPNFDACYDWVKAFDPSRPVQYERAVYNNGGRNTDIACPMYWNYDPCERYAASNPSKPLIQCEYAHAMGNSMGGFGEYWELIRKYPGYQGGFIWDFVDQSLRKRGADGVMIYGYGGDRNPYDASDQNFCDNGLVSPDRIPNPHMQEVRYWQQPLWSAYDAAEGVLSVQNENFFRTIDNCYLRWTVLCDGEPVKGGVTILPAVAPQSTVAIPLAIEPETLPAGELVLRVEYRLRDAEPLLAPDHRLAWQQFILREAAPADLLAGSGAEAPVLRTGDRNFLIVENSAVRIDFRRSDGLLARYEVEGRPLLDAGAVLEPNFWRAPTDNDFGARVQRENRVWADPGLKLAALEGAIDGGTVVVTALYDLTKAGGRLAMEYRIDGAGAIVVTERLTAGGGEGVPDLLRFGVRMRMPAAFDRIDYYGRGPWENYADRKAGAMLGRWRQTVDEQFYPYIRPQECGTKSDVRRWHQMDRSGRGVAVTAAAPFSASALHYAQEALDEGEKKRQGHSPELKPERAVWLCIDGVQSGLGCVDSWHSRPRPEYLIPYADRTFRFRIEPLK